MARQVAARFLAAPSAAFKNGGVARSVAFANALLFFRSPRDAVGARG